MSLDTPRFNQKNNLWIINLIAKQFNNASLGKILINKDKVVIKHPKIKTLVYHINKLNSNITKKTKPIKNTSKYGLFYGDGIKACVKIKDNSISLLLTDPPYGISSPYNCEKQIPRRMRNNGSDFIMPKGEFGKWDYGFKPTEWTDIVLPKIKGWVVIFCAQAQIKEYTDILLSHKFNSVGTLVWHKTNPVPFNHRFKPINAWEAAVIGKRPGTKFNGKSVHNVFTYKSPSPQHRIHPTQKPVELFERLIELFSDKRDTVFDPFTGSCTTGVASTNLSRKFIAYENNQGYHKLAETRLKELV